MPKRLSKPKRPTDINQLAHQLVRNSTAEREPELPKMTRAEVSRFMTEMGRKGGKKSAKARMQNLSPEQRSEIAANAARQRWANRKKAED
jgi:cytochrome c553